MGEEASKLGMSVDGLKPCTYASLLSLNQDPNSSAKTKPDLNSPLNFRRVDSAKVKYLW